MIFKSGIGCDTAIWRAVFPSLFMPYADSGWEEICSNISNLSKAGIIAKVFLYLDIIVMVLFSTFILVQFFSLKNFIKKSVELRELSPTEKTIFTWSYRGKCIITMHPIFMNACIGLWITQSNLGQFSSKITIEGGLIILISQCFISLLIIASYFWEISALKRRNRRKFINNQEIKVNEYNDDNSLKICSRV